MSMTEKEAKEKNCPFTYNIPGVQSSTAKEYLCVGSKCMAWSETEGGHCMLIESIPGWLSRIAYKLGGAE